MQYALIFYNLQLILAPMGLHPLGSPGPPPASHAFLRRGGGLDARQAAGRLTPCLRAGRALVTGSGPQHALLTGEAGEPQREARLHRLLNGTELPGMGTDRTGSRAVCGRFCYDDSPALGY